MSDYGNAISSPIGYLYGVRTIKSLPSCLLTQEHIQIYFKVDSSNSDNLTNIHLQLGKNISLIGDIFLPN